MTPFILNDINAIFSVFPHKMLNAITAPLKKTDCIMEFPYKLKSHKLSLFNTIQTIFYYFQHSVIDTKYRPIYKYQQV